MSIEFKRALRKIASEITQAEIDRFNSEGWNEPGGYGNELYEFGRSRFFPLPGDRSHTREWGNVKAGHELISDPTIGDSYAGKPTAEAHRDFTTQRAAESLHMPETDTDIMRRSFTDYAKAKGKHRLLRRPLSTFPPYDDWAPMPESKQPQRVIDIWNSLPQNIRQRTQRNYLNFVNNSRNKGNTSIG